MPKFLIIISTLLLLTTSAHSLDIPARPDGYVTDKANLLSPQAKAQLEAGLRQFEQQTTNQVVVVTFESLEDEALEDFSIRLAEKWKVGQKDKDNGVILLIFHKDRKLRIEVGYGLEGVLPDALAGVIIQQVIVPHFRKGEFEKGIFAGIKAIIQATQGEFKAPAGPPGYRGRSEKEIQQMRALWSFLFKMFMIAVVIFFVIDLFRYKRYKSSHKTYRGRYSFWEWWFRFAILLFVLNILFKIVFYTLLFSRGGSYGSRGGFGGFSGGGGSFGGGGASGSW